MDRRMTARYSGVSIGQSTDSEKAAHAESRSARGIDKRMRDCLASLLLLSCAAAPVAHGQDAAPNVAHTAQDGGIVVTGKGPEPIRKARRYLHQVLESDSGQLARFVDPVCPLVLGLPERFRAPIEERFRIVAAASSVRLARAKCQPNLMIVFADDADALIETMRKRRNAAFANLDEGALRDAFKAGPIHAWRLIVTRDDRGNIATGDEDPDFPTIFESETQTVTINSVIVIDKRAAQGKSVRQIADYAAMRTLVGARPPARGAIAAASILSLFDPATAPPPAEITDMDLGLLAGLYRLRDPYAQGGDHAYRISRAMVTGRQR